MLRFRSRWLFRSAALSLLVACGGGGDGGTGANAPASINITAGNAQIGAAGAQLADSMTVVVRDAQGAALGGVTVTWAVGTGGGSVSPTSATTNSGGFARAARTLGPSAGAQTATATVSGLTPVGFNATAQVQGAVNIVNAIAGPISDTTLGSSTLTVLVTDQVGAPVQGVTVNWTATGGQVSSPSVATNAAGHSSVTYTYGASTASNYSATAAVSGLVGSPVVITLAATAGNATQIAKTLGDNTSIAPNGQQLLQVTVRDARNNPKSGVPVNWVAASGGGGVNPASSNTNAQGNATTTRTVSGTIGPHTTTATAPSIAGTPQVTFSTTAAATITVTDNAFIPNSMTVPVNTTVTFAWSGPTSPHNITFAATPGAPSNEGNRTTGSVTRDFTTAGTFNFTCTNHAGMAGTVTVTP